MTGYRFWLALGGSRHEGAVQPLRQTVLAAFDCSKKLHDDQASKHINHYPT